MERVGIVVKLYNIEASNLSCLRDNGHSIYGKLQMELEIGNAYCPDRK